MGVAVTFNYASWLLLFPEFTTTVSQPQAEQVILPLAETYCRNDGGGPVTTAAQQTNLLNLMVAHCAQLLFGSSKGAAGPLVGRISSASQGSVSVSTDFPQNANAAWFNQTVYGAMFWVACAPYRTMRYLPGPRRNFNAFPGRGGSRCL
jgi:hypothetical protein